MATFFLLLLFSSTGLVLSAPGRGYSEKKLKENMECEIMMVVQEEATDSYRCCAKRA